MSDDSDQKQTEYDLETAISSAIGKAFPRLNAAGIQHQIEFTIRLGHATITAKGRESWIKRGRADILLVLDGEPLAILELKRPDVPVTDDDGKQGLSYARLLPVMAPFVVATNGDQLQIIETFSGQPFKAENPDEKAFEALMKSAGKVAAGDRDDAISTLMGTDPQVWTRAVAVASATAMSELAATTDYPRRPFGPLKIFRRATEQVVNEFRVSRLVLVSGPPLTGKTNVLEQLVHLLDPQDAGGLFLECGASEIFRKIADLLSDTLDWPVDPEAARNWVRQISRRDGPALILAIDRLDPEDRDDVRVIEDLMSSRFGDRLRLVAGLDEDATRRVMSSSDGRRESVIGRHAAIVQVDDLDDREYETALNTLAELGMGIMDGGEHSPDLRRAWLLQAMATRVLEAKRKRQGIAIFPAVPGLEIIAQARADIKDPELRRRFRGVAQAIVLDAQDQSKPYSMALQLMGRYFVRRETLEGRLSLSDTEWLIRSGYLNPSISAENTPMLNVTLPELLASELARLLAIELRERADDDPVDAAEWLAGAASNFLFGDIVAAQAFLDLGAVNRDLPYPLFRALADMTPIREQIHPGQHLQGWVEGVGDLELRPQEDGSVVLTLNGEDHIVDTEDDPGESIGNAFGWQILSQLASRRLTVETESGQHRLDPQALLLVGTADFVLRQSRNDMLAEFLPVHDGEGGGQFICHDAGVVEAITQSMLRYLSTEPLEARDSFITAAMEADSIYLTARLDIALQMATRLTDADLSTWATGVLVNRVRPALMECT
ncbi:hypothetical protein GOZ90_21630 [Agrobacterium vitis]|uniref:Restriction endonuclease type I HsdR N-terminal domain-containing protein n=1 Tax=Agrobacterium vitis TaxID=373 RepID=A0A6L6VHJ3_AGRVI|nr:hypothetical protein [Agrobacterium vitis]